MPSDSDTESEPESSQFQWIASNLDCSKASNQVNEGQDKKSSAGSAKAAVETLRRINICEIPQNQNLHTDIFVASNAIIDFLEDPFATPESDGAVNESLSTFTELVQTSFLSLLFDYRRVFHAIAAEALVPGTAASTVVCWVDVILAILSETVVNVARGVFYRDARDPICQSLRKQSEDNNLRAAAQLPQTWPEVPAVTSSERASPAAKRLALRLTFAVYIMGPQFRNCDPWSEGGVSPSDMLKIAHTCITKVPYANTLDSSSSNDDFHEQDRITCAMIISLFAHSDSVHQQTRQLSPFRPRSLALLLHAIELIVNPENTHSSPKLISPREVLDPAQIILLRWGTAVPWCWKIWSDQRMVNAEYITHLTATWLVHLDKPLFERQDLDPSENWTAYLLPELAKYPAAASSAIVQILHHGVLSLCSPMEFISLSPLLMDVFLKCCWATVRLLNPTMMNGLQTDDSAIELCKCLCHLFVFLGSTDEELQMKCFIVEALTLVPPDQFQLALQRIQGDATIQFDVKLDDVITKSKRAMLLDSGQFSSEEVDLLPVKLVLDFLTILWRRGSRERLLGRTISTFLSSLVDRLSHERSNSRASIILCDSLLTTLATLELIKSDPSFGVVNKLWEDETIWQLAMEFSNSNLPVVSGFAQYILSIARVCDSLCCAEAWDYLRDALLLVLSHSFAGEDEPLSLIVCPSICLALLRLWQLMDAQATRFILSSPWTITLCADLKTVLDNRNNPQDCEYFRVLRTRLERVGRALLNRIKRKLRQSTEGPATSESQSPEFEMELLFCHLYPHPRLILAPRIENTDRCQNETDQPDKSLNLNSTSS